MKTSMILKIKMIRLLSISFFSLLIPNILFAQIDFNQNCKKAYTKIFQLQFSDAEDIIKYEKNQNSDNAICYYLEDYLDCIKILVSQKESDINLYNKNFSSRIREIKKSDNNSPYYLYCISEMYFHSALIKINSNSMVAASFDLISSLKHIKKNIEKFPGFILNKKLDGVLNLFMGSVPDNYKWFTKLIGFSGDINTGLKKIDQFYTYTLNKEFLSVEGILIKGFSLHDFSDNSDNAYGFISNIQNLDLNNPLVRYTYSLFALKSGYTDKAIKTLEGYKPSLNEYRMWFFEYLLGRSYLYKLDKKTISSFNKFLHNYEGMNYIPASYQKLSWYYFLTNDLDSFEECKNSAITKGNSFIETDKQARDELKTSKYDPILLKARIYFDGGYYDLAKKLLIDNKDIFLAQDTDKKGEYYYRLARVYHKQKNITNAKEYYLKVLEMSDILKKYFVPNSALNLAYIYEKEGSKILAKEYYEKCLNLNNYQFSFGIEKNAKTGLNRFK
ncbi:tetratricopeptide repeat protein [Bacteroidota bacterium]